MPLDPEHWTNKTREAFQAASAAGRGGQPRRDHPGPSPDAPCSPSRTTSPPPLLARLGVEPTDVQRRLGEQLSRLARAVGGSEPTLSPGRPRRAGGRRRAPPGHGRRVPVGRAPAPGVGRRAGSPPRRPAGRAAGRPRQPPGDVRRSRVDVPGPGEVRPGPDRAVPPGQARPGHRSGRGDPPRHPGAVSPHQEQPGAHRRARCRQDGHRRGARQPDHRRRRARGARRASGSSPSISARWSPGPSTAASSRSG